MRYWPLSVILNSPLMPPAHAWALSRFYTHLPPESAFEACLAVARQTQPIETGLVIIESEGAPFRTVYSEYPSWEEWSRFERAGVFETSDGFLFMSKEPVH